MLENNVALVSRTTWKILVALMLSIVISFMGISEVTVLKKITGIYQLTSLILILLVIIYLLVPFSINNYSNLLITSIIASLTVIFVYLHNDILWSSRLSISVLPLTAIIKLSLSNSSIIRPVFEIDWGQVVIVLILLKIWISLLKYLRSLKF